jgi:hypothetical protein
MARAGIKSHAKLHGGGLPHTEVSIWEGLPQAWPDRMYSWQPEPGAWQSAAQMRAVCQGVIPVVAIPGIWLLSLANERIPVSAILNRQFLCLLRHTFLTNGFLGVRQICCGLFRPKLYTNGLSWQTISWYHLFNNNTENLFWFDNTVIHRSQVLTSCACQLHHQKASTKADARFAAKTWRTEVVGSDGRVKICKFCWEVSGGHTGPPTATPYHISHYFFKIILFQIITKGVGTLVDVQCRLTSILQCFWQKCSKHDTGTAEGLKNQYYRYENFLKQS